MAFDLGLHYTLDDANSMLDPEVIAISQRITPANANEFGVVWNMFRTRATPFLTDEFEVLSRNFTPAQVTVQASNEGDDWDDDEETEGLPVSSGTIDRITIGDVLLVENEVVVVSAVNRSANTIDVYERGAGESVAAEHGEAAITALVIGNAHREGRVDPEAMAEQTGIIKNWCQLVEESVDLTYANTEQSRKLGRTEPMLKQEAVERVTYDLARSAIYNVARANTKDIPGMSRGLLNYLDLEQGRKTNVAGAFTETALNNALDDVRQAGGSVNAIVMNVKNKRIANGFTGADASQFPAGQGRTQTGGIVLDGYLADGFGTIPFVVDLDMPNDRVALVNSNFLEKGWKENDQLRFEPEPSNSRQNIETLQGKFGFSVEQVGRSHHLLKGLTTS